MAETRPEARADDWERLRSLCRRAGLPPERVDPLAKAWAASGVGGVVLLAGSPQTAALVLARWLDKDAAATVAEGRPLVVGPDPESVQPPLGSWPVLKRPTIGSRHVVFLPIAGAATPSLRAALAALGTADLLILATRLSQPFSEEDRRLAASLASCAATGRAIVVALPSEEGTPAERAELAAYGIAQMEAHGFRGRCLDASVWYTEGERPPDTVQRLEASLETRADDVASGRAGAGRAAVESLLAEIERLPDRAPETVLSLEESDEICRDFARHVADLGKRVRNLADAGEFLDATACRRFLTETLQGWGNRPTMEGMLLDRADHLRPGLKAELYEQSVTVAEAVRYTPAPPKAASGGILADGMPRRLGLMAAAGVAAYAALYFAGAAFLQGWFLNLLCNIAATVAVLGVFVLTGSAPPAPAKTEELPAFLPGWETAAQRITDWFNRRIRSPIPTLGQECAAIRSRFLPEGQRP